MTESYPLHWPASWPRTQYPQSSKFKCTLAETRDLMFAEIHRLGGKNVILSTNVELRLDGLPYANRRDPVDTGVAVYFERKGNQMVFACDRWGSVRENIRSIQKTIEALRGIDRWGASNMMERAFTGFMAIAGPAPRRWHDILGVNSDADASQIKSAYRRKARECHPDNGGSAELMAELNAARDQAVAQL